MEYTLIPLLPFAALLIVLFGHRIAMFAVMGSLTLPRFVRR
jgi:hypothetical protein